MEILKIDTLKKLSDLELMFDENKLQINFFQSIKFLILYIEFYKKDFEIYLIKEKSNFIILPLNNFKYKKISFCGFIGTPLISEENDAMHNVKNFNQFKNMMDYFFLNIKKKYFFHNIKNGFFRMYMSKNFHEVERVLTNTIKLNDENFTDNSVLLSNFKKKMSYNLRKFNNDTNLDVKKIQMINLDQSLIKSLDVYKFILENKNIKIQNYYKEIINFWLYISNSNIAKINVMKIENLILSLVINIKFQDKFYYILPCYNKKFHKYSFGKFHLYELIKECKNNRTFTFFLGPGKELYKKEFLLDNSSMSNFTNSRSLRLYYLIKKIAHEIIN